jgi:predicted DsbA family dithiol-disulfide isomerase
METHNIITVDIVSDTICPWCFVGKRRIEAAASSVPAATVVYKWHPYQLDPTLPAAGVDKMGRYVEKFGEEGVRTMLPRMLEVGKREGIAFDYGGRIANTLDSHRLLDWALKKGGPAQQNALVEQLFGFYFERRGNLGDRDALAEEAEKAGLSASEAKAFLNSEEVRSHASCDARHLDANDC